LAPEGFGDDGETEEGGVVEDEGELGGEAVVGWDEGAVEEETGEGDGQAEHQDAAEDAEEEIMEVFGVVGGGERGEEGGGHEDGEQEVDRGLVEVFVEELDFAEEETKGHQEADHGKAGVEEGDVHDLLVHVKR
jgi:hypothetical protein